METRARIIEIRRNVQDRGTLAVIEGDNDIPFVPKRIFYVESVPFGEVRGQHAHLHCHQLLIAISGSVTCDAWNRDEHQRHVLTASDRALYMPPLTYGSQSEFSPDAVLLVLASENYDVSDYIDSREDWMTIVERAGAE